VVDAAHNHFMVRVIHDFRCGKTTRKGEPLPPGEMPPAEILQTFSITDAEGEPIGFEDLPLVIALTTHKPAHRHIRARSADGDPLDLQVTALPVEGEGGRHLGAMVAFWEASE